MRGLIIVTALALSASAHANGAMGLGLEMFELSYWFAYVGVTVVLEAWLIGRWIGQSWPVSLGLSILANLFTGVMCGGWGFCAPFLHTIFVGDSMNPNLFLNAVALLLVFAVPSAIFESLIWNRARKEAHEGKVMLRSIGVHLATVPVGLTILLIPAEPYRGLVGDRYQLRHDIKRAVQDYVYDKEHAPTQSDPKKLIEELQPYMRWGSTDKAIYGLYRQDRGRFSTGENWKYPVEVNKAVLGKKVKLEGEENAPEQVEWFLRLPAVDDREREWTVSIDFQWGSVE